MALTEKERNIIRFYEGDTQGDDPFYSDPKAYLTINSLFFEGVENELARTDEKKKLNPAFLDDDDRLLDVITTLYESGYHLKNPADRILYRVERYQDYLAMKERGATVSFTSTSTAGFLNAYSDKRGLALLVIHLKKGVPCIDMAEVLDYYKKAEESEVLLLPGTKVKVKEKELPKEYLGITDMDGKEPQVYAEIVIEGIRPVEEKECVSEEFDREKAKEFYGYLNAHKKPTMESFEEYLHWKEQIRTKIRHNIADVQKNDMEK